MKKNIFKININSLILMSILKINFLKPWMLQFCFNVFLHKNHIKPRSLAYD